MAVVKSDLKKFLDAKKSTTRLLGDVERHLLARPVGDRSTLVLHPSEIIKKDFCKRASYFLLSGRTKIAEKPPLRLQSIFDEGHYIHAKWQSYFQEMGVLHGNFKCDVCDSMTWGTSPSECVVCQAPASKLVYAEVTLYDDKLRIKGHTDGWVRGIGSDTLIEIKSIGPGTIRNEQPNLMVEADGDFMKAWKSVRRPFGSHILQGQMYLELMDRMGMRNSDGEPIDEIVFIYELKADQDFKEFSIKRDFELVRHVFETAKDVVEYVKDEVAPDCNNNPGGTCKQCAPYKED
jgi:CRISPR/Cas system-associated exonuclease Cas4 (RecB family)